MREISLTQGQVALVDNEDFEWLNKYNWCVHDSNPVNPRAVRISAERKLVYMTRQIMNCPDNLDVDHRSTNTLDNQRHNLRICTHRENLYNIKSRGGTSKFKGVAWNKNRSKWEVYIRTIDIFDQRIRMFLGYHDNEEAAALAYDEIAREEHRKFGRYNFPLEGEQSAL